MEAPLRNEVEIVNKTNKALSRRWVQIRYLFNILIEDLYIWSAAA